VTFRWRRRPRRSRYSCRLRHHRHPWFPNRSRRRPSRRLSPRQSANPDLLHPSRSRFQPHRRLPNNRSRQRPRQRRPWTKRRRRRHRSKIALLPRHGQARLVLRRRLAAWSHRPCACASKIRALDRHRPRLPAGRCSFVLRRRHHQQPQPEISASPRSRHDRPRQARRQARWRARRSSVQLLRCRLGRRRWAARGRFPRNRSVRRQRRVQVYRATGPLRLVPRRGRAAQLRVANRRRGP